MWRGVWLLVGVGALIVWVFRFTLPESPRYLATHGRGDEALDVLGRLGIAGPTQPLSTDAASDTKSDPFGVVFRMFPIRVVAGMICFTAFFGVAIGLGAWLPNIMNGKGFSITKSLQYTLAMNFAVPCASIFMMYALDKFGRKITSVCAFVAAGLMAIVFANAGTAIELMVAGFIMIFFVQVAGNSMQIFASEVFPTNARASGFGWAVGRRPARDRVHHADDLVGAERLGPDDGVRVAWRSLLFIAAVVGHAARSRGEAKKPRRDRAADGVSRAVIASERRRAKQSDGRRRLDCFASRLRDEPLHYRKLPQKRWMRVQASSSALVAVA